MSTGRLPSDAPLRLAVIGGGRMGEALLGGLLASGWCRAAEVLVVEPVAERRDELAARFAGIHLAASVPDGLAADGVLVAVKPQHVAEVTAQVAAGAGRILSIAAGVRIATIEAAVASATERRVPVIRSMPNTPALVGAGASAIAPGASATAADVAWAAAVLGAVGVVEQVDEKLLDAVTGLSGSGPAYLFLVAEALIDAGVAMGLTRPVATTLATQTILGAGRMLVESGDDAATLRANVTSPGGTTAAGLRSLEERAVRSALIEAVAAATARSRELG